MKNSVDQNWWKNIFDEVYLLTDSRSVGDDELTCREVDFIESYTGLEKSDRILDLCSGQGRHSLELARRGYPRITALDYSHYLIRTGEKRAEEENLQVGFIQGDARETGLPGKQFTVVFIMASSFGYFVDERENIRILSEVYRLLDKRGLLLLDLPDRDYCINHFKPHSKHHINKEVMVTRKRMLENDVVYSLESVHSKKQGLIRESSYCIRLYTPERITKLLNNTGFTSINCESGFMDRGAKGDFGCMTNRMVVKAIKS